MTLFTLFCLFEPLFKILLTPRIAMKIAPAMVNNARFDSSLLIITVMAKPYKEILFWCSTLNSTGMIYCVFVRQLIVVASEQNSGGIWIV